MQSFGKDIYNQLKVLGPRDLWAWGAEKYRVFDYNSYKSDLVHKGGLIFKVNGLLHKKEVMIRVQANDTYNIQIGRLMKGKWSQKKDSKKI